MTALICTRERGSFYLYEVGNDQTRNLLAMHDEAAVLFDPEPGTLHKHGDPEKVRCYHADLLGRGAGLVADWVLVSSRDWDPKILNKMLACDGYAGVWYAREMKVLEAPTEGLVTTLTIPASK